MKIIEKYFEASKTFQDLSNFKKDILYLLTIKETFKNHRKLFWSLQDIPGLFKLQDRYFWPLGNPGDFSKSEKNILKLPKHSRPCQTSGKVFLTFWKSRRLLKIIEKYLEDCKTMQDLSNFRKDILDLLAI